MKRKFSNIALAGIAILLCASTVFSAVTCVSTPDTIGLIDGSLRPCPNSPNCVNSEESGSLAAIEPLRYSGERADAYRSLLSYLEIEAGAEVETANNNFIHAVYTTPLLHFRDDVEFHFAPVEGIIHVRSASRLGYSDMGTNRRRIESIRENWIPPSTSDSSVTTEALPR